MTKFCWIAAWLLLGSSFATAGELHWRRDAYPLPQAIWAVEAIDVNGDRQRELIAVGASKVWSIAAPGGEPTELADTPGGSTIHAVALDCDADGDRDLALGRSTSDWIAHRQALAAGKRSTAPKGEDWTVAWIENVSEVDRRWPLHVLDQELHGVHGLWTGDVDRDGAADLLADSFAGPHLESSLAWFAAPTRGEPGGSMPRHLITRGEATGRPHYMEFADVNQDGRGDVLLGASTEGTFTWWEQPSKLDQPWRRQVIAREPGATHPRAADLNSDGKLDVIGSAGHGEGVFWYAAPKWDRHVIDPDVRDVHAFDAADLDGDGDIDCAGCSFSQKIVRWWENRGNGIFRAHSLDSSGDQEGYDLKIIDLDADGRSDILLAGRRSQNAVWYRNVMATQGAESEPGQLRSATLGRLDKYFKPSNQPR